MVQHCHTQPPSLRVPQASHRMVLTRAKRAQAEAPTLTGAASLPPEVVLRILDAAAAAARLPEDALSQALPRTASGAFHWLLSLRRVCRAWAAHLWSSGDSVAAAALARRWRLERLRDVFWRSDFNAMVGPRRGAASFLASVNGGRRFRLPDRIGLPMPDLRLGGGRVGGGGRQPSPPALQVCICKQLTPWERAGLPLDALMLSVTAQGGELHVAAVMRLLEDVNWLDERAMAWMIVKIRLPPAAAAAPAAVPAGGASRQHGAGGPGQQTAEAAAAAAAFRHMGQAGGSVGAAAAAAASPPRAAGGNQGSEACRKLAYIDGRSTHTLLQPYKRAFCEHPRLIYGMNLEVGTEQLYCCPVVTGFRRRKPQE